MGMETGHNNIMRNLEPIHNKACLLPWFPPYKCISLAVRQDYQDPVALQLFGAPSGLSYTTQQHITPPYTHT